MAIIINEKYLGKRAEDGDSSNGHEYVDLGLSVKWAAMNLGAAKIDDLGGYFAWGETDNKEDYYRAHAIDGAASSAYYWSSTRNRPFEDRALCLYFIPNFIGIGNNGFRNGGFTIRPVI